MQFNIRCGIKRQVPTQMLGRGSKRFEREHLSRTTNDRRGKKTAPATMRPGVYNPVTKSQKVSHHGTFAWLKPAKPVNVTLNVFLIVAYLNFEAKPATNNRWCDRIFYPCSDHLHCGVQH